MEQLSNDRSFVTAGTVETGILGDMAALNLARLIAVAADTIAAHAEELTALDQAIGDGDHGLNMKRGFEAVRSEAEAFAAKPLPEALKAIGSKLQGVADPGAHAVAEAFAAAAALLAAA